MALFFAGAQSNAPTAPSIEEEARRLVKADYAQNGIPRRLDDVFSLIRSEAVGRKFIKTYEFAVPIDPVTAEGRAAMRDEARQKFRSNVCPSLMRPLLRRGLVVVQKFNYFRGGNIVTTEFSEADCR